MKKLFFTFLALFLLLMFSSSQLMAANSTRPAEETWTRVPAGAKPSYMGIHGGTMPVSLLVSDDGTSLFTFVGLTGNDFMEVLKKVHFPLPSFGNSTGQKSALPSGETGLFAGNATASLPVFNISGDRLANLDASQLQPFGLSSEPLSIEGQVMKPNIFPHARPFRSLFLPDYFQPRRLQTGK